MKLKKIIIVLMVAVMLPLVSNAFEINVSCDTDNIKNNDEVIIKVKTEKKVVAANFEINYNNKVFEFIDGININAAEKGGKIACIYGDLSGKGQDEFLIKMKAINGDGNSEFKIENIKVRCIDEDESFLDKDITGNNSVSINVQKSGINFIHIIVVILLVLVIILIIYFRKNNKRLKMKNN